MHRLVNGVIDPNLKLCMMKQLENTKTMILSILVLVFEGLWGRVPKKGKMVK